MQSYAALGGKSKAPDILTPPPATGAISVYAQKLTALAFITLCSTVVFGHQANIAFASRSCDGLCGWHIALGVGSFFYSLVLLLLNHLAEGGQISRDGCFTHGREVHLVLALIVWWGFGIITVSLHRATDGLVLWFSWLAFFGSVYCTFKAYHSFKEEDLPTVLPDGFDGDDFVYG